METSDVVIVGAGVVGLAAAWEIEKSGARVTLVDRHPTPGAEQSSHNSGVIHSGAFLRPGSVRAELALAGNPRLYAVAQELGVRAERCGTLVVALDPSEVARLDQYLEWGRANGVPGTLRLDHRGVHEHEPELARAEAGLWLPSGGRIDVSSLLPALTRALRDRGVGFELGRTVVGAGRVGEAWVLRDAEGHEIRARRVVNAAGVGAGEVAALLGHPGVRIYPCLGEYARVVGARESSVRTMVYGFPPPDYPGIGVHLTRRVDGVLLLGPTASYLESAVVPPQPLTSLSEFAQEASRLLPGLAPEDLVAHPPGIRAKLVPPGSGEAFGDFLLGPDEGDPTVFHLFGIESPGLTASFALGARVADWARGP